MDTREKHEREEARRDELELRDSRSLLAEGKNRKRKNTNKINRLWLWFGVLVLIFILIWWLWTIGIFGDLTNTFNG